MRLDAIIQEMLRERQELLVDFCRLTGLDPYTPDDTPTLKRLAHFCQTLVDYAGIAHFEIFEKLADGAAEHQGGRLRARALYQPLVDNTQALVDFNDHYDTSRPGFGVARLADDLSALGESLAARFEIEDELIRLLQGRSEE
jgi:regulator of sigma D